MLEVQALILDQMKEMIITARAQEHSVEAAR